MKSSIRSILAASLCLSGVVAAGAAQAQTTDGYHTLQVFPIVVDSASFTQRFTFRNPNNASITIKPAFFPGAGTAQPAAVACLDVTIAPSASITVASLRTLCPALVAGTAFGYLYMYESHSANLPFAAFSRVSNPQANGFSVEAFPGHAFTSATTSISGLRRLAATVDAPAFQTNCFVANLNDRTPAAIPVVTSVNVELYTQAGDYLGGTNVDLAPGKLTRLLDVFAAANAPGGNHDDAIVRFSKSGAGNPALMSFCTVQDNTSFGADFRIAKQEWGTGWELGGQDDHVRRDSITTRDVTTSTAPGRNFTIQAGTGSNTHVMYFRHPDWVSCELVSVASELRLTAGYGLEMRMLDDTGTVIAGGNAVIGFQTIFLGDKTDRGNGANTRYTIEVEAELASGVLRDYGLHCESGSGHTRGDVIRYHDAADRF